MTIHGVRIYPKSVQMVQGNGAPIFVHGRLREDCSDFFYIFRPTAHLWEGRFFVNDFGVTYGVDPLPGLHEQYGSSLVGADVATQLLLLRGEDFPMWAPDLYTVGGAFLPVVREPLPWERLKPLFWQPGFLTASTWPSEMAAVLHLWDDMYWQFFSTERSEIDLLIQAHAGDPALDLHHVDFDQEYPHPSNRPLRHV